MEAVCPKTRIQLCIVNPVRHSLNLVPWKDYKLEKTDLKNIYQSSTVEKAQQALDEFANKWDNNYLHVSESWRNHWHNLNT